MTTSEPSIEGVHIQLLKLLPNDRGRLMEVQRADDPNFPGFGQAYITSAYPGVVKAWYRHHRQIDQIAVVSGMLQLVLYDPRESSKTAGLINEIYLGELAAKLVLIPPGIWHGYRAIGTREVFVLHLNSLPFSAEHPDEDRLPADDPSIPFQW